MTFLSSFVPTVAFGVAITMLVVTASALFGPRCVAVPAQRFLNRMDNM